MKICPKCGALNKDNQRLCIDCDAYLGNTAAVPEDNYIDKIIAKTNRKTKFLFILRTTLFLAFYIFYLIFYMILSIQIDGNLSRFFLYLLLYIPCLLLFFFPFNKVYAWYRKKRHLEERYLSDFVLSIFRAIAWIYLLILYVGIYDMLNQVIEKAPK